MRMAPYTKLLVLLLHAAVALCFALLYSLWPLNVEVGHNLPPLLIHLRRHKFTGQRSTLTGSTAADGGLTYNYEARRFAPSLLKLLLLALLHPQEAAMLLLQQLLLLLLPAAVALLHAHLPQLDGFIICGNDVLGVV